MKVFAKDLRPGDVVRLEGGRWEAHAFRGTETTVAYAMAGHGAAMLRGDGEVIVNDTDWPFVLVRRAGEVEAKHDDTETFTAKVGDITWEQALVLSYTKPETEFEANGYGTDEAGWCKGNPRGCLRPGRKYRWRIKPKPVVPPTLEECLDALQDTYNSGSIPEGSCTVDILTRANRLPVKAPKEVK